MDRKQGLQFAVSQKSNMHNFKLNQFVAIVAILALTSCGDRAKRQTSKKIDELTSVDQPHSITREAVIAFEAIDFESGDHDGAEHGWNVERVNNLAKNQLKKIGQLLSDPKQLSNEKLVGLVSDQYQSGPLRPVELRTVYQDSSIVVKRPSAADGSPGKAEKHLGISGCLSGLRGLLAPLEKTKPIRTNFKIFRVSLAPASADLHVYFELTGQTGGGILQQRAVWESRWKRVSQNNLVLETIRTRNYEESDGKTSGESLLSDCTLAVLGNNQSYRKQLVHSTDYWLDRIELRYGIDPGAWLGMAVADVNSDGLDDLYLCQPGGLPNRLFVQKPDGTATDVSAGAGVDWLDHSHSALLVDLDNDADQDLVLALKKGLVFLSNNGKGQFQVRSTKPIPKSNPYALSAADYNEDGFLDIYVCCYSMRRGQTDRQFIQRPVPYHDANNGGRNVLLKNLQNWSFQDVTSGVGLEHNNRRFSFAAAWEDFDNDGDLDLYVANDYGRNNLYRNDLGQFTDIAATAGVEDISAGMSVSWSDYNNDGWMDLYVSNMFSSAGNRIAYQRQFRASDRDSTRADFQRHARGNSLFQNLGNGSFRDVSVDTRVSMGRWAWGSNFVDINNDGLDDLVVANGFITQEDTTDL